MQVEDKTPFTMNRFATAANTLDRTAFIYLSVDGETTCGVSAATDMLFLGQNNKPNRCFCTTRPILFG
jgi:hypothetical protein